MARSLRHASGARQARVMTRRRGKRRYQPPECHSANKYILSHPSWRQASQMLRRAVTNEMTASGEWLFDENDPQGDDVEAICWRNVDVLQAAAFSAAVKTLETVQRERQAHHRTGNRGETTTNAADTEYAHAPNIRVRNCVPDRVIKPGSVPPSPLQSSPVAFYPTPCDTFAVGVVILSLLLVPRGRLSGWLPWEKADVTVCPKFALFAAIGVRRYARFVWGLGPSEASDELLDVLAHLLQLDPDARPAARAILKHPYLKTYARAVEASLNSQPRAGEEDDEEERQGADADGEDANSGQVSPQRRESSRAVENNPRDFSERPTIEDVRMDSEALATGGMGIASLSAGHPMVTEANSSPNGPANSAHLNPIVQARHLRNGSAPALTGAVVSAASAPAPDDGLHVVPVSASTAYPPRVVTDDRAADENSAATQAPVPGDLGGLPSGLQREMSSIGPRSGGGTIRRELSQLLPAAHPTAREQLLMLNQFANAHAANLVGGSSATGAADTPTDGRTMSRGVSGRVVMVKRSFSPPAMVVSSNPNRRDSVSVALTKDEIRQLSTRGLSSGGCRVVSGRGVSGRDASHRTETAGVAAVDQLLLAVVNEGEEHTGSPPVKKQGEQHGPTNCGESSEVAAQKQPHVPEPETLVLCSSAENAAASAQGGQILQPAVICRPTEEVELFTATTNVYFPSAFKHFIQQGDKMVDDNLSIQRDSHQKFMSSVAQGSPAGSCVQRTSMLGSSFLYKSVSRGVSEVVLKSCSLNSTANALPVSAPPVPPCDDSSSPTDLCSGDRVAAARAKDGGSAVCKKREVSHAQEDEDLPLSECESISSQADAVTVVPSTLERPLSGVARARLADNKRDASSSQTDDNDAAVAEASSCTAHENPHAHEGAVSGVHSPELALLASLHAEEAATDTTSTSCLMRRGFFPSIARFFASREVRSRYRDLRYKQDAISRAQQQQQQQQQQSVPDK